MISWALIWMDIVPILFNKSHLWTISNISQWDAQTIANQVILSSLTQIQCKLILSQDRSCRCYTGCVFFGYGQERIIEIAASHVFLSLSAKPYSIGSAAIGHSFKKSLCFLHVLMVGIGTNIQVVQGEGVSLQRLSDTMILMLVTCLVSFPWSFRLVTRIGNSSREQYICAGQSVSHACWHRTADMYIRFMPAIPGSLRGSA